MVLGGGPAGLVAAITAAAQGHRVALTEQRLTGGTCVNFGCTPSKALIRCARAVHEAGRGAEFGFGLDRPPKMDSVQSWKGSVGCVPRAASSMRFGPSKRPVRRYTSGTLLHRTECRRGGWSKVAVSKGGDCDRIGPSAPSIPGVQTGEYLTNESVFSLTELPKRLVVIGGGPLGCELAQAFRRLGSEVDLVSATENLLPRDEPEIGPLIRRRFEREGIRLHLGFKAVRAAGGRLTVQGAACIGVALRRVTAGHRPQSKRRGHGP